jgi:two-component system, chemotaxis family, response regulator Rcp1
MSKQQGRPIEILLVEDNSTDIMLTKEGLADAKLLNNLSVVTDGLEALSYLRKQDKFANATTPDLILLDLNLPIKSGLEVLAELKQDPKLKSIPTVILTTSKQEQDIIKAYGSGANCYITKPVDFPQFCEVIKEIEDFWFTVVTLPPRNGHL